MPGGLHPPLSVIVSWPLPNLVDPDTRSSFDWIICLIFLMLAFFAVVGRIHIRGYIQRDMQVDDWLIVWALLFACGMVTCIVLNVAVYNFNRHIWDAYVDQDKLVKGRKTFWVAEHMNLWGVACTKLSILFFTKRLSGQSVGIWMQRTIWFSIAFVGFTTVAFEISLFLECQPLSSSWNQVSIAWTATHNYRCNTEGPKVMTAAAVSLAQDFIVATLPLMVIWNVRLPTSRKTMLKVVFAIAYLVCAVGIARTVISYVLFYRTYDVTWNGCYLGILVTVELALGIVVACTPALRSLATHVSRSEAASKLSSSFNWNNKEESSPQSCSPRATHWSRVQLRGAKPGLYTQELVDIETQHSSDEDRDTVIIPHLTPESGK